MTYIPKSKINILNTSGGEFVLKSTNQEYIGDYIELSNGKFYAGNNSQKLDEELIIPLTSNKLGNSRNNLIYSNLKPKKANFLAKVKTIYPTKTLPTQEDYNKGYYTRYFIKKVNEPKGYMEVNVDVFDSINQQKNEYDFYLYEVGLIVWNLKNGTLNSNFKNIQILEKRFPFISNIFPILNEFEIIDDILVTQGGELYYEDGKEYVGPYHIHENIPMVGPQHTEEPHATLYYSKDLQNQNQAITNFMNQNLFEIQMQQMKNKVQKMQKAPSNQTKSSSPKTYQKITPSSTGGGGSKY